MTSLPKIKDNIASKSMLILTIILCLIFFLLATGIIIKSLPVLKSNSLSELLFSSDWRPTKGRFGMLPFIVGTLWVSVLAIIIAVPICILTSFYLTEYAKNKILYFINPLIDILAGIPSVVFGLWGVIFIIPMVRDYVAPFFGLSSSGYSILAGGLTLAIMIIPVIIHVLNEVFRSVPHELREASLSLGATKWQTIKLVVFKKAMPGVIAAIVLGFSRALGETMAVLMVVGNVVKIPANVFDSGYPLPALIANNYGEMMSIPGYESALMFSALLLLVIVVLFNALSRLALIRVERMVKY